VTKETGPMGLPLSRWPVLLAPLAAAVAAAAVITGPSAAFGAVTGQRAQAAGADLSIVVHGRHWTRFGVSCPCTTLGSRTLDPPCVGKVRFLQSGRLGGLVWRP
jgi:hypothetical protein